MVASERRIGQMICQANNAIIRIGTPIMIHEPSDRRALRIVRFRFELPVGSVVWGRTVATATITVFLPISPPRAACGSLDAGRARSPTQPGARGRRTRSDLDRPARRARWLLDCATFGQPDLPMLQRITPPSRFGDAWHAPPHLH